MPLKKESHYRSPIFSSETVGSISTPGRFRLVDRAAPSFAAVR